MGNFFDILRKMFNIEFLMVTYFLRHVFVLHFTVVLEDGFEFSCQIALILITIILSISIIYQKLELKRVVNSIAPLLEPRSFFSFVALL